MKKKRALALVLALVSLVLPTMGLAQGGHTYIKTPLGPVEAGPMVGEEETQTFTVTFNSNGGTPIAAQTVKKGEKAKKPDPPTKEGFRFNRWYLDENFEGYQFNFNNPITQDIVLHALWKDNEVPRISLEPNDQQVYLSYGADYVIPRAIVTDNVDHDLEARIVIFKGHNNEEMVDRVDTKSPGTYRVFYHATDRAKNEAKEAWVTIVVAKPGPLRLDFDTAGGGQVAHQDLIQGQAGQEPDPPTREGFEFLGWYLGQAKFDFTSPLYQDTRLVARWRDSQPPKISISPEDLDLEIDFGQAYELPRVIVTDNLDKDLEAGVEIRKDGGLVDSVDTKVPGVYTISFRAQDSEGNKAESTLTLRVKEAPSPQEPTHPQEDIDQEPANPQEPPDTDKPGQTEKPSRPGRPARPSGTKKSQGTKEVQDPIGVKFESIFDLNPRAKYIQGYEDGTFRPDAPLSRAEVATMIARVLRHESPGPGLSDSQEAWYSGPVSSLSALGLIQGYEDGSLRPENKLTRAEFATIISRILRPQEVQPAPFKDSYAHYAQDAIDQVYGAGLIKGYPDGCFRPDGEITRAEACVILNRLLGKKAQGPDLGFADLGPSHWAYEEILKAAS